MGKANKDALGDIAEGLDDHLRQARAILDLMATADGDDLSDTGKECAYIALGHVEDAWTWARKLRRVRADKAAE